MLVHPRSPPRKICFQKTRSFVSKKAAQNRLAHVIVVTSTLHQPKKTARYEKTATSTIAMVLTARPPSLAGSGQ